MSNEQKVEGLVSAESKHPLLGFVPATFNSFEEWLAGWNGNTYLDRKLGLLHSLTTEGGWWNKPELVSFLLEVADGYCSDCNFIVSSEKEGYCNNGSINAKNRQAIAEKAFGVLCMKFFKGGAEYEIASWWWMLKNESLFQKTLWFLRPQKVFDKRLYNCEHIHSIPLGHHQEVFRIFLRRFARLGWNFRSIRERHWDEEIEGLISGRLVASRPQFIDILHELNDLTWLNGQELDPASLSKLTEMALSEEYDLPSPDVDSPGYRKPINLQEAVLGGSIAAQVVLLYRIRNREQLRINALFEKSRRRQKTQAERLELVELENQRQELAKRKRELQKRTGNS